MTKGIGRFFALALSGLLLSCEPLVLDPSAPGTNPGGGAADLYIANFLTSYPGTYAIYLFNPAAMNAQSNPAHSFGPVAENQVVKFPVPAGSWKLAMSQTGGTVIELTKTAGSEDWPVVDILKDSSYALELSNSASEENIIVWWLRPYP